MSDTKITVVYDAQHVQHHPLTYPGAVGLETYPENPSRIETIIKAVREESFCEIISSEKVDISLIKKIHSAEYLNFLQSLERRLSDNTYYYPTEVFHPSAKPHDNILAELGRFSFDLSAPIDRYVLKQALISASSAYTAAYQMKKTSSVVYSASRPPGHHAMKNKMGGFCYINNTALAAQYLSQYGSVAILDVDYHHGNGTQDIFYERNDVLTVSIHADPTNDYPYYWGFEDEIGEGKGKGYNKNFPLKHGVTDQDYQHVLLKAIKIIHEFKPKYLVVALGLDTYEKDMLGSFKLTTAYYQKMAETIKKAEIPTVIIQEGGYYIEDLGKNTVSFLKGFTD